MQGEPWKCDPCTAEEKDPRCTLCPRRGGAFKPTNESLWAHTFCGRNAPGLTRVTNEGIVEIRMIPKECKRVKCDVCTRPQGVCVRCTFLGCTTFFHPLCVEREGKGYLRTRLGVREAYCHEHIPEGVDRCDGYLVDGGELYRLR
jgi:bromodomain and PHD finger-containing protein 1